MVQDGDGNCEHMVEQLRLQVGEAAEVLSRKKISLVGAIYLSNVVIMPSALYRLKLSSATDEQIDRIQSPLRQAIAKKAHITAAHTNVLYGGYIGCGWKRWRDGSGGEMKTVHKIARARSRARSDDRRQQHHRKRHTR
jgi:hypothetical protein